MAHNDGPSGPITSAGLREGTCWAEPHAGPALVWFDQLWNSRSDCHETIASPSSLQKGGVAPDDVLKGNLLVLGFKIGLDSAYRLFKIPPEAIAGTLGFHLQWTKTDDVVSTDRTVRWRFTFSIFNGSTEDGAAVDQVVDVDTSYLDGGTATRSVYFDSIPGTFSTYTPGHYVSLKVETVTPGAGTPLTRPGLATIDMTYQKYTNRPVDVAVIP